MNRPAFPRVLAAALVPLGVLVAFPAFAGNTGALRLDVVDPNGAAIEGAALTITDPTTTAFRMEKRTDRRGRTDVIGLNPREYNMRVEMQGYQIYESNFAAHAGETTSKKVTLTPLAAGAVVRQSATGEAEVVEKKVDPWAVTYNEAIPLYREDKDEEALAKLEASLRAKPDFAPALMLKGTILEENGKCEEAVPALKLAFTLDPNSRSALGPLIRCLDRTGRKDEAAAYRKIQSEAGRSKIDLYNDAVAAINAGDDAAAAPLLEQALQQDETFAPAQYQYGLVLFRRGEIPAAVARLETYLKLAPQGEFASDDEGLLKALKP